MSETKPIVISQGFMLQYWSFDANQWIDGSAPFTDEVKARAVLDVMRTPAQQKLFAREWRLIERVTTERVLDEDAS